MLPETRAILASPSTHYWLKAALREALEKDPVDALHDAETLLRILRKENK
jgi:hypothetical protein